MPQNCFLATLLTWSARRWLVAASVAIGTLLLLGLPTAVIPNPVFGREIAPTDWAFEVLVITSVLGGLLAATYVRNDDPGIVVLGAPAAPPGRAAAPEMLPSPVDERPARRGAVGAFLAYLAIGCPVCNKVVLLALGSTGAIQFFAPVQPYLGAAGLIVLTWALVVRLRGEMVCSLGSRPKASGTSAPPPHLVAADSTPTDAGADPAADARS